MKRKLENADANLKRAQNSSDTANRERLELLDIPVPAEMDRYNRTLQSHRDRSKKEALEELDRKREEEQVDQGVENLIQQNRNRADSQRQEIARSTTAKTQRPGLLSRTAAWIQDKVYPENPKDWKGIAARHAKRADRNKDSFEMRYPHDSPNGGIKLAVRQHGQDAVTLQAKSADGREQTHPVRMTSEEAGHVLETIHQRNTSPYAVHQPEGFTQIENRLRAMQQAARSGQSTMEAMKASPADIQSRMQHNPGSNIGVQRPQGNPRTAQQQRGAGIGE